MKIKAISLMIIFCFVIVSCESIQGIFDSIENSISGISSSNTSSQTSDAPSSSSRSRQSSVTALFIPRNDPNRRGNPDIKNWDIALLDTAADVDYLTGIEKDVILEMNKVRTNPRKYAELYIQPKLRYFSGLNYSVPGQITILTQEGTTAVNACITALNKENSVGVLTPEKGLSLAAKDHVADQSKTGQIGHDGSDRSTPEIRMRRYGIFNGSWTLGENIDYGNTTGREIVCSLLIDDGVPSRGHRTVIMNKAFTQTGAGYGTHTQYRTSCTITYANGYASK